MERGLTDYEDQFRSDLINGRADPWEISSPREELKNFRFFVERVETFIDDAEQSEVESMRQSIKHLPAEAQDEFWLWNYPVHWDEIFRSTLRGSVVVSLATFTENFLGRLCYRVRLVTKARLDSKDQKENTINRARRFLQSAGGFRKPDSSLWDEVGIFFKFRNVIVHGAGFLAGSRYENEILRYCEKRGDIRLYHMFIEVQPEFLEHVIDRLNEFVDQLEGEFRLLCERIRERE